MQQALEAARNFECPVCDAAETANATENATENDNI